MKKKDILILIIAFCAMGISIFFVIKMISPKKDTSQLVTEAEIIPSVPANIDEQTYQNVETLSDYGTVTMEGIGKSDLFSGF